MIKQQNKEINQVRIQEEKIRKKEAKQSIQRQKDEKREEAYNAVIELKNYREKKVEEPSKKISKTKPPPPPKDETSEEEEEEEIEEEPKPVERKIYKKPPPPINNRRRPPPRVKEPTDEELYENANLELLRKRFIEQSRNRLMGDLFNY